MRFYNFGRCSLCDSLPVSALLRVLIKPRLKKNFHDRFVWAFSHKGLSKIWGSSFFSERLFPFLFPDLWPFWQDAHTKQTGKTFFGRGIIRTQERTACGQNKSSQLFLLPLPLSVTMHTPSWNQEYYCKVTRTKYKSWLRKQSHPEAIQKPSRSGRLVETLDTVRLLPKTEK